MNIKRIKYVAIVTILLASVEVSATPTSSTSSNVIDAIIATVDEKPITLVDLKKRLKGERALSLDQISSDPEIKALLERMILEQAILAEAESRKMSVTDADIDRYLDEVAKRNNLSKDGLIKALEQEKRDIKTYREQIKVDILQSRLTNVYLQGSSAVSKEEIDAYMHDHPELTSNGAHVKIRRILVDLTKYQNDQLQQKIDEIKRLLDKGESFDKIAATHSDGPEAHEGGLLGVVAEKDLSPDIFDKLVTIKKGEISPIISSNAGLQIIKLEDRYTEDSDSNAQIVEEVKRRIQSQKMESKMQSFFTTELFKHHTVDKKI